MVGHWIAWIHVSACLLLALFGLQRFWILLQFFRARGKGDGTRCATPSALKTDFPYVTVQLPIYNEKNVCRRLIDSVCALDYPRSKLEIQVLDDSTDETRALVSAHCAALREQGFDIVQLTRSQRIGYKAGALAAGLHVAKGEFIAIFDADFLPGPAFLRDTLPAFSAPDVGMVQTRWGHLNRGKNLLTRAQSLFLDAHFSIEHAVRHRMNHFFNFNGTAGVWRKSAIEAAGGWDAATLTEDLDLSFRAQLAGSRFIYLDHVEAGAELPEDINAFKGQQHRWAKGSIQTARRLLPGLWRAGLPWDVRLDATFKLLQNLAFLWLALVLCTMPVVGVCVSGEPGDTLRVFEWSALLLATIPVSLEFIVSQRVRQRAWWEAIVHLPLALGVGAALSLHNTKAVLEGIFGWGSETFVRTPKSGARTLSGYAVEISGTTVWEIVLGFSQLLVGLWLVSEGQWSRTPFLFWFGLSLSAFGLGALWRKVQARRSEFFSTDASPKSPPNPVPAEK